MKKEQRLALCSFLKRKDKRMNNKTDSKIFILFLLNEINYPLDYSTVSDVMTDAGYVEMFDFA